MLRSKVFSIFVALCMTVSGSVIGSSQNKAVTSTASDEVGVVTADVSGNGTVDLAIANDQKLIDALKKRGIIPKNASGAEADKLLRNYLASLKSSYNPNPNVLTSQQKKALNNYKLAVNKKGLMKKSAKAKAVDKNTVTKDKDLVLLIQFKDYAHNSIKPTETDMYYPDYTPQHYSDMVFSKTGYKGPNGENLISLRQYYDQQSGGTYDVEGKSSDWYTSQNNAAYYGANQGQDNNIHADELVKEALIAASKDPKINLSDYDLKDPYDLDGDGDTNEPDGIIDHLMIIHSGIGEEAGGGVLGENAIWSHSSKIFQMVNGSLQPYNIPGTKMYAFPYTMMPEDGAAGVFAHEFGHDLGLPDEYDTIYSGAGEPIEYWSIMSSGSWAGKIPGTEPSGFSPWAKQYFQKTYGGKWQNAVTIDYKDIKTKGKTFTLDQASVKGKNPDVVKLTLPNKTTVINKPASGTYEYFSGKGDNLNNYMTANVDLTKATKAVLNFNTWYNIEKDWDYASIQVKADGEDNWTSIQGNITTTDNPNKQNPGFGITGNSNGWVQAEFDLSKYSGKKIQLMFNYWTDPGTSMPGFYVDDIKITADNNVILSDDAEGQGPFTLSGFAKNDGKTISDRYYLIEWRNHAAADAGLGHILRATALMSYDPGMVVWYADDFYTDNWTGPVANGGHPGEGFLGIVDSDQNAIKWSDGSLANSRYQMHDAAFSLRKTQPLFVDAGNGKTLTDNEIFMHPFFDDSRSYLNSSIPDCGRNIPKLGVKFYVTGEAKDRSSGTIVIKK